MYLDKKKNITTWSSPYLWSWGWLFLTQMSGLCVLFLTWRLYFVIRPTLAFMTLKWSPGPQHYSAGRWRKSWDSSPPVTNPQDVYAHWPPDSSRSHGEVHQELIDHGEVLQYVICLKWNIYSRCVCMQAYIKHI